MGLLLYFSFSVVKQEKGQYFDGYCPPEAEHSSQAALYMLFQVLSPLLLTLIY